MLLRNITKFTCFVIPAVLLASCASVSLGGADGVDADRSNGGFHSAEILARIASEDIRESSGVAVSKCQPDVFWTHNDSAGGPFIYAINSKGESLGTFKIPNAENVDWEDIAAAKGTDGGCFIFIGDIGDNELKHDTRTVYRVKEPSVSAASASSSKNDPLPTLNADALQFSYRGGRRNAETLMVEPSSGDIYVISKHFDGPATVFKLAPDFTKPGVQAAVELASISMPASPAGLLTGGDISPDGKHVILCDYYSGYELTLPPNSKSFDEVWKAKPVAFDLGPRHIGEAIAFGMDANVVFATTEGKNAPLIRVRRRTDK